MSRPTGKVVLVVDDESAMRNLTAEVVERRGHQVKKAPDGAWALRILAECPEIQLVIMDIQMPRMNGLETLKAIRAGRNPGLPVVLLTGQKHDEAVVEGYTAGADYYVTKPVKPDRVLKIIDYLIGDLSEHSRSLLQQHL